MLACSAGICGMPVRQAIYVAVHVPEEEQEKEDDGFLQLLPVCQVSSRVTELHRSTCDVYTRKYFSTF